MKKLSIVVPFVLVFFIATMFAGCGSSSNTAATGGTTGTITADGTGTVAASTTITPPAGVSSMTFASSSVLTDSTGAPVTGTITTTVSRSTSASSLPAAAPAGTSLAVLLDIDMSAGATKVKNFSTPLTVIVAMPAGVTSVDVYSFDGTNWVLEQAGVAVIGGNATFDITHLSVWGCFTVDTSPDQFSFTAQADVALSTVITSNTITVAGISSPAPISVSGGSYSVNGGAFTSVAGTVTNGQTVAVQHTSSALNSTVTTTTLTIGGVSGSFTSTTVAAAGADTTPDQFSFTAQTGVALSTVITSNTITVAGINSPAPISITGGAYSINGGAFTTTAGTVTNGQTVAVQHTSSASNSAVTTTTLTIGGVSAAFTSTTLAAAVDAAAIYQSQCSGCHILGTVDPTGFAPNLSGLTTVPNNFTPGVATGHNGATITLSAAEITALSAYVQAN
ncbi:MAG: cytochrome c [Deltaproteobacteria bacterium]|nr:cytochrome c [Deltaproteobacteria bacterium]TLN04037.1 MAG: cytochrome c [bacterium]